MICSCVHSDGVASARAFVSKAAWASQIARVRGVGLRISGLLRSSERLNEDSVDVGGVGLASAVAEAEEEAEEEVRITSLLCSALEDRAALALTAFETAALKRAAAPSLLKETMSSSREDSAISGSKALTPASERAVAADVVALDERRGVKVREVVAGSACSDSAEEIHSCSALVAATVDGDIEGSARKAERSM